MNLTSGKAWNCNLCFKSIDKVGEMNAPAQEILISNKIECKPYELQTRRSRRGCVVPTECFVTVKCSGSLSFASGTMALLFRFQIDQGILTSKEWFTLRITQSFEPVLSIWNVEAGCSSRLNVEEVDLWSWTRSSRNGLQMLECWSSKLICHCSLDVRSSGRRLVFPSMQARWDCTTSRTRCHLPSHPNHQIPSGIERSLPPRDCNLFKNFMKYSNRSDASSTSMRLQLTSGNQDQKFGSIREVHIEFNFQRHEDQGLQLLELWQMEECMSRLQKQQILKMFVNFIKSSQRVITFVILLLSWTTTRLIIPF